jgi:hypothetical protein
MRNILCKLAVALLSAAEMHFMGQIKVKLYPNASLNIFISIRHEKIFDFVQTVLVHIRTVIFQLQIIISGEIIKAACQFLTHFS